jgi:hypothetical protein
VRELQFLCSSFFIEKIKVKKPKAPAATSAIDGTFEDVFPANARRELTVSTASEGGTSY